MQILHGHRSCFDVSKSVQQKHHDTVLQHRLQRTAGRSSFRRDGLRIAPADLSIAVAALRWGVTGDMPLGVTGPGDTISWLSAAAPS